MTETLFTEEDELVWAAILEDMPEHLSAQTIALEEKTPVVFTALKSMGIGSFLFGFDSGVAMAAEQIMAKFAGSMPTE